MVMAYGFNGKPFHVERPATEKEQCCGVAERASGTVNTDQGTQRATVGISGKRAAKISLNAPRMQF